MDGAALAQLLIALEPVSHFTPLQALAEVASRAAKECTGALLLHMKDSARPVAIAYVFEELAHTLHTNAVPGSLLSRALRAAASEVVTNVGELTGVPLTREALLPLLIRAVDRVGDVDAALGGVPANPRRLSLRAVADAAVVVAGLQGRPKALKSTLRGLLAVVQLKLGGTSAPKLWAAYLWLERAQGWAHARWTVRDAASPGRAGAAPAARKLLPTFKHHAQPCTPFPCEVTLLAARMCGPRDGAVVRELDEWVPSLARAWAANSNMFPADVWNLPLVADRTDFLLQLVRLLRAVHSPSRLTNHHTHLWWLMPATWRQANTLEAWRTACARPAGAAIPTPEADAAKLLILHALFVPPKGILPAPLDATQRPTRYLGRTFQWSAPARGANGREPVGGGNIHWVVWKRAPDALPAAGQARRARGWECRLCRARVWGPPPPPSRRCPAWRYASS
jgi:hypothetical protein